MTKENRFVWSKETAPKAMTKEEADKEAKRVKQRLEAIEKSVREREDAQRKEEK